MDGISVAVTRKPIRSLRLVVLSPGATVRLSAPKRIARREIDAFIRAKLTWIRRQQERILAQPSLDLVNESAGQKAAYREQLKGQIPSLIAQWEPRLGVQVVSWRVRAMRSRWGSCNPRSGRLSFSLALAKHPPECLEYIVVHEMLHLLEPGHGRDFKALMSRHFPTWKVCRAQLNGKMLY
jgi:predicted metal-dependent hydrolase